MRGLSIVRVIVLAWILDPKAFGQFSIALVASHWLNAFLGTGFGEALVQKKGNVERLVDTAWTVQSLRGLLIGLALLAAASPVAAFFGEPEAAFPIRVMAVVPMVRGVTNFAVVLYRRELEFRKRFALSISDALCDFLVSIAMAIWLRSAIALVLGMIAGSAARAVLSCWIHPHRPRFRFNLAETRELLSFGRWIAFNNILVLAARRGDTILVGKFLGVSLLGSYEMGRRISEVVTTSFAAVVESVAFPVYAQVQDDRSRVGRGFLMVLSGLSGLVLPLPIVLWVLGGPLVLVVLGPEWAVVGDVLPYLAMAGSLQALTSTGSALFLALGKPRLDLILNVSRTVVTFSLMLPLIRDFGLVGAGMATVAAYTLVIPPFLWFAQRLTRVSWRAVAAAIMPGVVLAGAIALVMSIVGSSAVLSPRLHLLVDLSICLVIYASVTAALWLVFRCGPVVQLNWLRRRLGQR